MYITNLYLATNMLSLSPYYSARCCSFAKDTTRPIKAACDWRPFGSSQCTSFWLLALYQCGMCTWSPELWHRYPVKGRNFQRQVESNTLTQPSCLWFWATSQQSESVWWPCTSPTSCLFSDLAELLCPLVSILAFLQKLLNGCSMSSTLKICVNPIAAFHCPCFGQAHKRFVLSVNAAWMVDVSLDVSSLAKDSVKANPLRQSVMLSP